MILLRRIHEQAQPDICIATAETRRCSNAYHVIEQHDIVLVLRAIGLLLLIGLAPAGVSTGQAFAQEFNPETELSRKIFIQRISPGETTSVMAGSTLDGIAVARVNPDPGSSDTAFTQWLVEPSSAARIITALPAAPLSSGIAVEFLEVGTVTLTAYGYDDRDAGSESQEPDFNTVVFTFNVVPSQPEEPVTESSLTSPALNDNTRAVLTTLDLACSSTSNATVQGALADTCNTLDLQDTPAVNIDRMVPEEFFAIGDALITTADNQISNVRSRINTVRTSKRHGFDIGSLNVRLWDQTLGGAILDIGKDALTQFSTGKASRNGFSNSALGLFANGNVSVGEVDGQGIQRDADINSNSLTLGLDYRVDGHRVVGAAVGIVNDTTDFSNDNGDMQMQGVSLSAFGTWYEHDTGHADIIVDVGRSNFDLSRRINFANQADEYASSSADATRVSLSINAGRTFHRGAVEFGPVVRIALSRASIGGFTENSTLGTSGAGTTLNVKSHAQTSSRFSLGGEIKRVISTSKAVYVPSLRVELQNESETDKGAISASFTQDPDSNQMQIRGTERDRSALLISVGSTIVFADAQSAFIYLETRAQDDFVSQNRIRAGYRMQF